MTNSEMAVVGILAAFGAAAMIIGIIWYILQVIAKWKIFNKMDEAGWKSIIPFYSDYIVFKRTWKTSFFWILLVMLILVELLQPYSQDNVLVSIIVLLIAVAAAVIAIIQLNKLSKSFGHGAGFTVGLVFLNPIFLLILGFGSSEYIGNTTE